MEDQEKKTQKNNTKKIIVFLIAIIIIAVAILVPKQLKMSKLSSYAIELANNSLINEGYENLFLKVEKLEKEKYTDIYSATVAIEIAENITTYDPFLVAQVPQHKSEFYDNILIKIDKVNVYDSNGKLLDSSIPINNNSKNNEISDDEFGTCWALAKDVVKSNLKSPSSAKFPFSYNSEGVSITKSGDTYTVKAWVDADNSFGANIRSNFTVTMEKSGSGKNTKFISKSCIID